MNILFLAHADDSFGAPKAMIELINQIETVYEVNVIVIIPKRNKLVDVFNQNNIQYKIIPYYEWGHISSDNNLKKNIKRLRKQVINFFSKYRIAQICLKNHIDIIHTNVGVIDIGYDVSKIVNIPHIWHIRESGVETNWVHYEKKFFNKHNSSINYNIAISHYVKENWVKRGIDKKNITVIYDGIDEKNFQIKTKQYKKDIKLILLGALEKHKGQNDLIDALSLLRNVDDIKADIVGEGDKQYKNDLINKIEDYGLSRSVTIKPYSENVPELLNDYDIGLNCSKGEGFGRVTIEYMLAGLPVIASNTGANPELVKEGFNGKIYEYGNINDLSEKILFFLNNKELIKDFGICGNEVSVGKFTIKAHAENIIDFYNSIEKNT